MWSLPHHSVLDCCWMIPMRGCGDCVIFYLDLRSKVKAHVLYQYSEDTAAVGNFQDLNERWRVFILVWRSEELSSAEWVGGRLAAQEQEWWMCWICSHLCCSSETLAQFGCLKLLLTALNWTSLHMYGVTVCEAQSLSPSLSPSDNLTAFLIKSSI